MESKYFMAGYYVLGVRMKIYGYKLYSHAMQHSDENNPKRSSNISWSPCYAGHLWGVNGHFGQEENFQFLRGKQYGTGDYNVILLTAIYCDDPFSY